jgi:hypothetical protein
MAATLSNLTFKPESDFVHICNVAENPFVLVVNPQVPGIFANVDGHPAAIPGKAEVGIEIDVADLAAEFSLAAGGVVDARDALVARRYRQVWPAAFLAAPSSRLVARNQRMGSGANPIR